jgi:hypothetical protein
MKRFILEQSDDEFYTSHSGLALAGLCINRYSDLSRVVGRKMEKNATYPTEEKGDTKWPAEKRGLSLILPHNPYRFFASKSQCRHSFLSFSNLSRNSCLWHPWVKCLTHPGI